MKLKIRPGDTFSGIDGNARKAIFSAKIQDQLEVLAALSGISESRLIQIANAAGVATAIEINQIEAAAAN
jgi:hypothetical protein